MKRIILASGSASRKVLLEQIGLKFDVEVSDYEEDMSLSMSPQELAKHLSHGKAKDVADKHKGEDCLVIGADSFAVFEGTLLGKPHTPERAKEMLRTLSGKCHDFLTGVTIIDTATGKTLQHVEEGRLCMRNMHDDEIEGYVATGEPLDKAGAYAIRGGAAIFAERVEGDYTSIIGLPLCALSLMLRELGVKIFP